MLVELDLRVVGLLADPHGERARACDGVDELRDRGIELRGRDRAVDQPPVDGGRRVDRLPGEQHLQRALAADRARERDHRRRAEQTNLHAGRGEARLVGGDRQVACGDELAAGGGGDPADLGDHGLGHAVDGLHELAAGVEQPLVEAHVAPDHLGEVVARRERRPRALDDDRAHARIGAGGAQHADQLLHELEAQRIALLGPVERDPRRDSFLTDEQLAQVCRVELHWGTHASS